VTQKQAMPLASLQLKGQASAQPQLGFLAQFEVTETHCVKGNGLSPFLTHTCPALQSVQSATSRHCPASIHGPQHIPTTLGTCPAWHWGFAALHVTFESSQLRSKTQRLERQTALA